MQKNGKVLFFIFTIIGLALLGVGIFAIIGRSTYLKTEAVFNMCTSHVTTDSDGDTHTQYWWHYDFYVNGNVYKSISKGHNIDKPLELKDIVLYNAEDPDKNMMEHDRSDLMTIVAGLMFLLPVWLLFNPYSTKLDTDEFSIGKKFGWTWLLFTIGATALIFIKSCCSMELMLKENGPALIILFVFAAIGVFLVVNPRPNSNFKGPVAKNNESKPNVQNDYVENNNDFADDNPIK